MAMIAEMPEGAEKDAAMSQMGTYGEQMAALSKLSNDEAKNTPMPGGISYYYFKEMDEHPVSGLLDNIRVPFLVLQGEKDFQVYAGTDYLLWQELLDGRSNTTFTLYEGLNHLFMPSNGNGIAAYQEEYKTYGHVDAQVLMDIAQWIAFSK